jgi:cobalt-zinc-cadmium efflux system outer membrane protein
MTSYQVFGFPAVTFAATAAIVAVPAAYAGESPADPGAHDASFAGAAELDRAALVQEVLRRNPSLQAAAAAWRAARARVAQERSFDDPMLAYEMAPLSISDDHAPFGHTVTLEQRLPVPGARTLRAEMASAEAAMARGSWAETELALAMAASMLYDEWYVAHRALDINAHHVASMEALQRSAEAQYAAGRGSLDDPLRAELELGELLQEQIMLESRRDMVRAEINGLLHRPPQAGLPPPPQALAVRQALPEDSEALQEQALRGRPELAATRAELRGQRAAVELARKSYFPAIGVMASYSTMFEHPSHQYMVGLSLELPVQRSRRRAAVDEARAGLARVSHGQERLEDEIRVEVAKARLRLVEAMRIAELYRTRLVPAARGRASAARAAFESGRGEVAMVLEAEDALRSMELRAEISVADVARRDAELARQIGTAPGATPGAMNGATPGAREGRERP